MDIPRGGAGGGDAPERGWSRRGSRGRGIAEGANGGGGAPVPTEPPDGDLVDLRGGAGGGAPLAGRPSATGRRMPKQSVWNL